MGLFTGQNSNIYLKTRNTIELYALTGDYGLLVVVIVLFCFVFVFPFILYNASINLPPSNPPQNQDAASYSRVLLPFALRIDKFHSKHVYIKNIKTTLKLFPNSVS